MNRRKGPMSYVLSFLTAIIVLGGVVAVLKINNIKSVDDLYLFSKKKSDDIEQCYKNKGKDCVVIPNNSSSNNTATNEEQDKLSDKELGYKGPSDGQAYMQDAIKLQKKSVSELLDKIKTMKPNKVKFNEKEWGYWALASESNDCWTTKEEVLAKQAVPDSLEFVDKNHNKTKDKSQACSITKGMWIDPYSGDKIKDVKDMTVDHIVSLKQANKMGGNNWDSNKKSEFANDMDLVMLAVSKKSKDDKGDKSPSEYTPKNKKYKCEFAKNYTLINDKYELSVTEKDKKELSELISKCNK